MGRSLRFTVLLRAILWTAAWRRMSWRVRKLQSAWFKKARLSLCCKSYLARSWRKHMPVRPKQLLTSTCAALPTNPPFLPGACLTFRNPTLPAQTLRLGTTSVHHLWNRWMKEAAASSPYIKDLPTHLRSIDNLHQRMPLRLGLIAH